MYAEPRRGSSLEIQAEGWRMEDKPSDSGSDLEEVWHPVKQHIALFGFLSFIASVDRCSCVVACTEGQGRNCIPGAPR